MALKVQINSVQRQPVAGTLNVSLKLNQRSICSFDYLSEDGSVIPAPGNAVEVFAEDATTLIWAGTVDAAERHALTEANPTAQRYRVSCVGWEAILDRRITYNTSTGEVPVYSRNLVFTGNAAANDLTVGSGHGIVYGDIIQVKAAAGATLPDPLAANTNYYVAAAGSTSIILSTTLGGSAIDLTTDGSGRLKVITKRAGDIAWDAVNTYAGSEGITSADVRPGGVVDKFIADCMKVSEVLDQMAQLSRFVWWLDVDRGLHFVPRTADSASFSLGTTSGNYRNIAITSDRVDKLNNAAARVAQAAIGITVESFVGDGAATEFTLTKNAGLVSYIQLNAADLTNGFGVDDVDQGKDWYWSPGEKTIRQETGGTVLTAGDTLTVGYWPLGSDIVFAEDSADVTATASAEGGTGRYMRVFDAAGLGQTSAYNQMVARIGVYKDLAQIVTYETDFNVEPALKTLRPGQLQDITNSYLGISGTWLIDEVTIQDIDGLWLQAKVRAVSGTYQGTYLDWFQALVTGSGSASAATAGSVTGGAVVVTSSAGFYDVVPAAGVAAIDMTNGKSQVITLDGTVTDISNPTFTDGSIAAGLELDVHLVQDSTGHRAGPTWGSNFASDVRAFEIGGAPDTQTIFLLKYSGTKWCLRTNPIVEAATT